MTRRTPLSDRHVAAGATMVAFAGWEMPLRYGSDLAEHRAVRTTAGLFDLSHMGELEVRGPAAGATIDGVFVGRLSATAVGRARYSLVCTSEGGVLDDAIVYRTDDEVFLVVANAANTDAVRTVLEARCRPDAQVVDRTERTALVALQGPVAADVLAPVADTDLADLRSYASVETTVAGVPALLARTGYTGEDGFEILCDADVGGTLWDELVRLGQPEGVVPAGLAARDSLRLEAGMPLHGNELTTDRSPFSAGLGKLVVLDKDTDFPGRDALADLAERDPEELLVGLVGEGRRAPRSGCTVMTPDGAAVGTITSGALSPTLGIPIAMAYVAAEHAQPDTPLAVDVRGRPVDVRTTEPRFYRRSLQTPRSGLRDARAVHLAVRQPAADDGEQHPVRGETAQHEPVQR